MKFNYRALGVVVLMAAVLIGIVVIWLAIPRESSAEDKAKGQLRQQQTEVRIAQRIATEAAVKQKKEAESESANSPPRVRVSNSTMAVRIENTGTQNWNQMVVYVNDTPPFTFKVTVAAPAVGAAVNIPLASFAKKDGTRFNPTATKVTQIWVGGGGRDFQSFNASPLSR